MTGRRLPADHARACDCPGCSCVGVSHDYLRTLLEDDARRRARRAWARAHGGRVALTLLWVACVVSYIAQAKPFGVFGAAALIVLTWREDRPWWLILAAALFATLGLVFET